MEFVSSTTASTTVLMELRNAPFLPDIPRPTLSLLNNTELPGTFLSCLTRCVSSNISLRYHSHFSTQYGNGVVGSIVINGPASLPYDIDLGPYPITDWYHGAAERLEGQSQLNGGAPPPSDNILFNGTNINPSGTGGQYSKVTLTPGKRHLLRLINPSIENTYSVSLVGHTMTVVETDLVPVNAFTTDSVYLAVGQRVTVTIDASHAVGNYWMNVSFSNTFGCGTSNNPAPAAIFSYVGANNSLPTNPGVTPPDSLCADNTNLVPIVTRSAPLTAFNALQDDLFVNLVNDPTTSKVFWQVNGSSIKVDWGNPTLNQVKNGLQNFPANENLIKVPQTNIVGFPPSPFLKLDLLTASSGPSG